MQEWPKVARKKILRGENLEEKIFVGEHDIARVDRILVDLAAAGKIQFVEEGICWTAYVLTTTQPHPPSPPP